MIAAAYHRGIRARARTTGESWHGARARRAAENGTRIASVRVPHTARG